MIQTDRRYFSKVDTSNNKVTGITNHLSKFALVQLSLANDLTRLTAYPNPCNPAKHTKGLTIDNLTESSVVKIYTITGEMIRELEYSTKDGRVVWYGNNAEDQKVASGIYIIYVEDDGKKKTLKIAVEK